jgi:hypothetical protein
MRNEKTIYAFVPFIPKDGVCICGMIILLYFFCSGEMLNYKLNAQGGFTPAAVAPPMR